ncbi:hypothetical protein FRB98_001975 [Tulasnella sp. 332]|nr:hypothetical protein FRB98_001975 [Tulasnella sp. 332]
MASIDPAPFEPEASSRGARGLLSDDGLVVGGIAERELISQEAIDYLSQPGASESQPFPGPTRDTRPWYRRPSPWLLFPMVFTSACLFSSTAGSKNEILISLACAYHRPEYYITPVIPSNSSSPILHAALSTIATTIPSPDRRCSTDPTILAAVARLVTGWWGQASVPGGYWFLVVTSAIDGVLGGMSTASAATHAYMADCVEPHARSRVFSLYMGTLFVGVAFGPTLGSIIIDATQDLLTPFYIALTIHMLMLPLYLLVLPESLSMEARAALAKKQHEVQGERAEAVRQAKASGLWHTREKFLALFSFLAPLAIFLPRRIEGTGRRDWNLTLLIVSSGIIFAQMGIIAYKTQYSIAAFGWRSQELGYWLTAVGITRAFHMVVILPRTEAEPLIDGGGTSPERAATPAPPPTVSPYAVARTDLLIARVSLIIDFASYIVVVVSGGPVLFVVGSLALSFGGGFGPAVNSLAMHLSDGQGSGKLFGAMAVATTIGSSLVGPAVFGLIYINTVGVFPKAIFVAAAISVVAAFGAMLLIRLPQESLLKDVEDTFTDEL